MKKLLICLTGALLSVASVAEHHDQPVRQAVQAFNDAYANNEVEKYFSFYEADAMLYFYGSRQTVADYHEEWAATIGAGGAVEKYDLSDLSVKVLPGGDVAVSSYFVDFRMRTPDGEVSASRGFESEVWQKVDDGWKIVSLHYTEIPGE